MKVWCSIHRVIPTPTIAWIICSVERIKFVDDYPPNVAIRAILLDQSRSILPFPQRPMWGLGLVYHSLYHISTQGRQCALVSNLQQGFFHLSCFRQSTMYLSMGTPSPAKIWMIINCVQKQWVIFVEVNSGLNNSTNAHLVISSTRLAQSFDCSKKELMTAECCALRYESCQQCKAISLRMGELCYSIMKKFIYCFNQISVVLF